MAISVRHAVFALGLLALPVAAPKVADAQTSTSDPVFLTVDSYGYAYTNGGRGLEITGVLQTPTGAVTRTRKLRFPDATYEAGCERAAIQVLNRPGRLHLRVVTSSQASELEFYDAKCFVVRVP